jgi:hypothetical protein
MRIALALMGGSLLLVGCQHFERARQCRLLADGVNPELQELSAAFSIRRPFCAEQLRSASKKYGAAAARIHQLEFTEPELRRLAQELGENLIAVSRSCDRLAPRFEHPEMRTDTTPERDLENLRQRHAAIVSAIDRFCQE